MIQFFTYLVDWFIHPSLKKEPETLNRARFSTILSLVLLGICVLYILLYVLIAYPIGIISLVSAILLNVLCAYVFRVTGRQVLASNLFILVNFAALLVMMLTSGGIHSPVIAWLFALMVLAFWYAGKRSGYIWSSVFLATLLALFMVNVVGGWRPFPRFPETYIPLFPVIIYGGLGMFFIGVILVYEHVQAQSRRQLEVANKAISEHNERLEHQKNEVSKALEDLKAAQAQLIQSEKMASLGQLTAGIAHEIKNPLNFVNNFGQLSVELSNDLRELIETQKDQMDAETYAEIDDLLNDLTFNAEKINEHGHRADNIVKGMLRHSRGKAGERYPVDLNKLLDEYVNLSYHGMRASHPDFNVTIKQDYDEALGEVAVVPQEMGRVFINLLGNAFYAVYEKQKDAGADYTPTVTVQSRKLADHVEIRVADNGTGIPEDVQEKIFEPFFSTKPSGEGTGLGLSMSYDVVTQGHGGTLTVESEQDTATLFIITLPLHEPESLGD
jgi:signal transduction histidine kinase